MARCILYCLILLFTLPAKAQEAKDLGKLDLDLNRLKSWETKVYTYEASRPSGGEIVGSGRIILRTEVAADSVLLDDRMKFAYRGKEISLDLKHQCKKDNFLSPKRIESKGEGEDEVGTFVVIVDGTQAKVRSEGKERKMDLPPGVVTMSAFYRLVTLLPREKGTRISFPYSLESEELNLKKDYVVECLGEEKLAWGEKKVTCTKFRLTGGGIQPAFFWVSDDDVVRQIVLDERKVIRLQEDTTPNPK